MFLGYPWFDDYPAGTVGTLLGIGVELPALAVLLVLGVGLLPGRGECRRRGAAAGWDGTGSAHRVDRGDGQDSAERSRWCSGPSARAGWTPSSSTDNELGHYQRRLDRPDRPWVRIGTVTGAGDRAGRLPGASGRWSPSSRRRPDRGLPLRGHGWQPARERSCPGCPDGPHRPPLSDLGAGFVPPAGGGHLLGVRLGQALTDEDGSVFSYHRTPEGRWERNACLRLHDPDFIAEGPESVKLAQVTGDVDATPTPWGERTPHA